MNSKNETVTMKLDAVKLLLAMLIVIAAIAAYYLYAEQSQLLRVVGLLAGGGTAIAIAMQTDKGRNTWRYFQDAQVEVRKVVWPTRQETIQTTLIVMLMVIVVAIFLKLLDMFLGWSIGHILGYGG